MGVDGQGPLPKTAIPFSYIEFKRRIDAEPFTEAQLTPLKLRLSLLESYMMPHRSMAKLKTNGFGGAGSIRGNIQSHPIFAPDHEVEDLLVGTPNCLKLVDLTDPHVDRSSACALFNLCLAVFLKDTKAPKVIALDEAHNVRTCLHPAFLLTDGSTWTKASRVLSLPRTCSRSFANNATMVAELSSLPKNLLSRPSSSTCARLL